VKEAEANEQHKSIISALGAAALSVTWVFELINFVAGNCGLVVESDFYTKFKKLDVQDGKKYTLLADQAIQACQAHDQRHCPWQASDSVCTTVLTVTLSEKKNSASCDFFWTVHNKLGNDLERSKLWLNPDLVGKWPHSPALPFLPQAQTSITEAQTSITQAQTSMNLSLNPSASRFPRFVLHADLSRTSACAHDFSSHTTTQLHNNIPNNMLSEEVHVSLEEHFADANNYPLRYEHYQILAAHNVSRSISATLRELNTISCPGRE